jgi:hypothetical protein
VQRSLLVSVRVCHERTRFLFYFYVLSALLDGFHCEYCLHDAS